MNYFHPPKTGANQGDTPSERSLSERRTFLTDVRHTTPWYVSISFVYFVAYDAIRTQTVMITEIIVASVHLLEPRFCFTTKTELVDGHHAGNPKSIEEFYKRPYSLNSSTLYQTQIDYSCCVFVGKLWPNCCTILFLSHDTDCRKEEVSQQQRSRSSE